MKVLNRKHIGFAKTALDIETDAEFAALIGVSPTTIRRIESKSADRKVRLDTLVKVREAIDNALLEKGWGFIESGGIAKLPNSSLNNSACDV